MYVVGISCFYHDSAACILQDGKIIAAAQEERFTRKKQDENFPRQALAYCLKEAGIRSHEIDLVAFYEKPIVKFERILETIFAFAPRGLRPFLLAIPLWLKHRLWTRNDIQKELPGFKGKIIFPTHHESHAASAFYPSPFDTAAIITLDGVGEWNTTTYGVGNKNRVDIRRSINFPHSLGMLYSAFTYYTGFKVNSGEYKLMGLAPYGEPRYADIIYKNLIDLKPDGSFRLNMEYFGYGDGLTMTNENFSRLFGGPPRAPEAPLTQRHMDLAASIQKVTEGVVLAIARHVMKETKMDKLCLAGGVALNCVANGLLLREGVAKEIWVQPAAGDAGGALGAALFAWHQFLGKERVVRKGEDAMRGSFLGPAFDDQAIRSFLDQVGAKYTAFQPAEFAERVADVIAQGKVVGWFEGRTEFGPRALGARSILGDARHPEMQTIMNLKIKFRESFRPFAPAVLAEEAAHYFEGAIPSPYMLFTFFVNKDKRLAIKSSKTGLEKLRERRSVIPAVTHVDYSARIQTVHHETNPLFYDLIKAFYKKTGCPVIINTSFNVRGEPIVCTPQDAWTCFLRTEIDYLAIGSFLIDKKEQDLPKEDTSWQNTIKPD